MKDITVTGLYKAFGNHPVFQDFTCVIDTKGVTGMMGASGSGKTTLANLLLGLEPPDRGHITGLENLQIAAVFQEDRLCDNLSAVSNIRLVLNKKIPKDIICGELKRLGLEDVDGKPVSGFSGGMRRRVAIVRAMMVDSDFIIMDEPFNGLDEENKEAAIAYILEKSAGKGLLVITHDRTDLERLGARIITL